MYSCILSATFLLPANKLKRLPFSHLCIGRHNYWVHLRQAQAHFRFHTFSHHISESVRPLPNSTKVTNQLRMRSSTVRSVVTHELIQWSTLASNKTTIECISHALIARLAAVSYSPINTAFSKSSDIILTENCCREIYKTLRNK